MTVVTSSKVCEEAIHSAHALALAVNSSSAVIFCTLVVVSVHWRLEAEKGAAHALTDSGSHDPQ
jgi:hypothetical protein